MPELIVLDEKIHPVLWQQLCQLQRDCFIPPWSIGLLQQQLNDPKALNFGLVSKGQLLGFVFYQLLFEQAEILQIATDPAQRRRGYAAKLLTQSSACLLDRDIEKLLLEVRASNHSAINLYQQLGFSLDGRRKNYYPSSPIAQQSTAHSEAASNREDALLFTLNLPADNQVQQ